MNFYVPQSIEAVVELQVLSSTQALVKSNQSSRLLLCINQDCLTGGYMATSGEYVKNRGVSLRFKEKVEIPKEVFNNALMYVPEWDLSYIMDKKEHIRKILKWKHFDKESIEKFMYSGHGLVSMTLRNDFEYTFLGESYSIENGILSTAIITEVVDSHICKAILEQISKEEELLFIERFNLLKEYLGCKITEEIVNEISDRFKLSIHKLKERFLSVQIKQQKNEVESDDEKEEVDEKNNVDEEWKKFINSNRGLFSLILPNIKTIFYPKRLSIIKGVFLCGILNKQILVSANSMTHKIDKDYGADEMVNFVSWYQFLINQYNLYRGLSVGIDDCDPSYRKEVKETILKSFLEAKSIDQNETDPELKERKINAVLSNATSIGQKIVKDDLQFENSLGKMVIPGAKGSHVNIAQIRSLLGQQNTESKRIMENYGGRTCPHQPFKNRSDPKDLSGFFKNIKNETNLTPEQIEYETQKEFEYRGFVGHSYMDGLDPLEFFFHAEGGREGVVDSACKTAKSGYIQRRLIKKMEDIYIAYNSMVVNSKNQIIQFNYINNFNPARQVKGAGNMSFVNCKSIIDHFNIEAEYEDWEKEQN